MKTLPNGKQQKGRLLKKEILEGTWLKVSDHGYHFIVKCLPDGTLEEPRLFQPNIKQKGKWTLVENMVFRMDVLDFELDVFANKNGLIHSGIEVKEDLGHPSAYFKVIHLVDPTTK